MGGTLEKLPELRRDSVDLHEICWTYVELAAR